MIQAVLSDGNFSTNPHISRGMQGWPWTALWTILSKSDNGYTWHKQNSEVIKESVWNFEPQLGEDMWPIGYGVGLRIKRSSVRIRPCPLRWVLGQGSLLPLSQGEAFTLASISYLAILVKYIWLAKKKNIYIYRPGFRLRYSQLERWINKTIAGRRKTLLLKKNEASESESEHSPSIWSFHRVIFPITPVFVIKINDELCLCELFDMMCKEK